MCDSLVCNMSISLLRVSPTQEYFHMDISADGLISSLPRILPNYVPEMRMYLERALWI
jgi:hypothetical protein